MPKKQILALVLMSLLASSPFTAAAYSTISPALARDATEDAPEADDQSVRRELELFRDASISLGRAMTIAQNLQTGSRIADIAFDGASGQPVYKVRTFQHDRVLEYTIDARTGELSGNRVLGSLKELSAEDRNNLIALKAVRQELSDAVAVAERAGAGKAISGGLMNKRGKLNFVIVIVSGNQLKQVELEPPRARGR